jgi:hypothetical protein
MQNSGSSIEKKNSGSKGKKGNTTKKTAIVIFRGLARAHGTTWKKATPDGSHESCVTVFERAERRHQRNRPCLVHPKKQNFFKILRHIESYVICMKY